MIAVLISPGPWPHATTRPYTDTAPAALVADVAAAEVAGFPLANMDTDTRAAHLDYEDTPAAWTADVIRAVVALVPAYATADEPTPVPVVVRADDEAVALDVAHHLAHHITALGITADVTTGGTR